MSSSVQPNYLHLSSNRQDRIPRGNSLLLCPLDGNLLAVLLQEINLQIKEIKSIYIYNVDDVCHSHPLDVCNGTVTE